MAAEWFYQCQGQPSGPVDSRELRRLAKAGIVRPDTLVRQGTSGRWVRAAQVKGFLPRADSPPAAYAAPQPREASPLVDAPGPKGVGGWLLFFCVSLTILSPLYSLAEISRNWEQGQPAFAQFPSFKTAVMWENAGLIALVIYGCVVGCMIWSGNPNGREIAKKFLLIRLFGFIGIEFIAVVLMGGMPSEVVASVIVAAVGAVFGNSIWFLIWWFYFKKSKRVRNTYAKSRINEFGEAVRTDSPTSCPLCSAAEAVSCKRTFLGFQRCACSHCGRKFDRPLGKGYRTTYWILGVACALALLNKVPIILAALRVSVYVFVLSLGEQSFLILAVVGAFLALKKDCQLRRAENDRGLFQRSTAPPSPSPAASPPGPSPLRSPVPESGAPGRGVSGESPIRHGLGAAAVNEASEKPERIWPVTWAAIIVGSGTVLLLLWALVFRGGSEPQQQAEKDQPLLAVAQAAESGSHTPVQPVRPEPPPPVARTPAQPANPQGRSIRHEGTTYNFGPEYSDKSIERWFNTKFADNRKLTPEQAGGRSLPIDSEKHAELRKSTPLSEQGIAEYAKEMGLKPEQATPEVLAEYIKLRKAEAERAAKDPDTNPVVLREYKEDTTAMERDVDRPWSNGATGEHYAGKPDKVSPAKAPPAAGVPSPPDAVLELADLAELVGPSVVQVNVTGPEEAGTGSGFVLDKQGTIVTNYHVIEDATAGRIVFSDRTSAPITGYVGAWPEKDIALVRVECPPEKLHPLRLATSAPRQGERVATFGSPLGLQDSVSEGIVSALRESKELRTLGPIDVNARLIQTTTPISHGNSGGPLVDMKGMVVGVNTWTFRFLGGENVNFAVAAVELPPLLVAKNETPAPLPASDPAANGVRRIISRAWDHVNAGEYDRAIADYTEAIRLNPKNALAYSLRSYAYCAKGDYDSAIADYTEAIRLKPKEAGTYFLRGLVFLDKRDYDSAIADFTEAVRLGWKTADVYYNRGQAYRGKRDYDSAIADYTEAIRLDPEDADTYLRRGWAYNIKGDADSAFADFTEVIRLDPKNVEAYHMRGQHYRVKGDYDSAIADSTQAIRLDPTLAFAYYNRGLAYDSKDEYDRAIADFTQAIRLDPTFDGAYYSRGKAYDRKGEYDRAIVDYTEAIRLNPRYAHAYYWRGKAYQARGKRTAAERDFAEAKKLGYKP